MKRSKIKLYYFLVRIFDSALKENIFEKIKAF